MKQMFVNILCEVSTYVFGPRDIPLGAYILLALFCVGFFCAFDIYQEHKETSYRITLLAVTYFLVATFSAF